MSSSIPRLIVTAGEPAGIGPDLCVMLAQQTIAADICVVSDPELIQQRAQQLGQPLHIDTPSDTTQPATSPAGHLRVIPVAIRNHGQAGQLDAGNARHVLDCLDKAIALVHQGPFDALVTGPVHKGNINDAGITFSGHTEWLAAATGAEHPVMMLANKHLRVALASTHLPLSKVSNYITAQRLQSVIEVLHHDLRQRFHVKKPRIRICGINPHAGEDGHLGREEIDIMMPVIDHLRQQGMLLTGPVPADTAFLPETLQETDAILAMYHDQGLPVLKHSGFDDAVNITLGLPIIRTSVDHGTALPLAGTGKARINSLLAAINQAIKMTSHG